MTHLPSWKIRRGNVRLLGPQIMGILNATPDSFSDGLGTSSIDAPSCVTSLVERALEMIRAGATWIDIGGESTRPCATPVDPTEEARRVVPLIQALRERSTVYISVDTSKASVAESALQAGADVINDVTALSDPAMAAVIHKYHAGLVLMHSRGTPSSMDALTDYPDAPLAQTILTELQPRIQQALRAGIPREAIALDPGFGFAKTNAQNEALLNHLAPFTTSGYPLLIGLSRKRFIGARIRAQLGHDVPPTERDTESANAALHAAQQGAHILRVHNVPATIAALGERFDVVDANDQPTGETVFRTWAHRLGIPHRTAHVWLLQYGRDGQPEILLQKRSRNKDSFPGCFDISSAGHLQAGTSYRESAIRELREELGINASPDSLHYLGTRHFHTETHFHGAPFINDQFSAVYCLLCPLDESAFRLQASEVESVHWIPLHTAIQRLHDPSFPNCLSNEELSWLQAFTAP